MQGSAQAPSVSKGRLWAGRIISGLVVAFLVFDAVAKLMKIKPVMEANARLGLPEGTIVGIGITLLVCTILYVIPRTAVLGAILLTGYLGGAVSTHVRAGDPAFPVVFPAIFGVLVWLALYLRDDRLHALMPLRRLP